MDPKGSNHRLPPSQIPILSLSRNRKMIRVRSAVQRKENVKEANVQRFIYRRKTFIANNVMEDSMILIWRSGILIRNIREKDFIAKSATKLTLKKDRWYSMISQFMYKRAPDLHKLGEELDQEKPENSTMDFSQRWSLKIRKFVENIAQYDRANKKCF